MQFSHQFFFVYADCESSFASKIWILLLLLCLSDLIEFLWKPIQEKC